MDTCALAAVCEERLLALLIIKLEPLTSVHTSRTAFLCRERWPGRRLACPVGLLGGRWDCRLYAGQDAVFSPLLHRRRVAALSRSGWHCDVHVVSHLLLTTCRSPPSSPTFSVAEWMFPWHLFHWWRGDRVYYITRRHSFISRESKRQVASHVRRPSVQSACLSSLFLGLPLHHPPRWLHQTSQQCSMLEQPTITVTSETIFDKKSVLSKW